jgi:putative nucleotidyltransferase with HDIG domain
VAIARELGLDMATTTGLRLAALVHDVGKLTVPAEILSKPSTLQQLEFELIKQHAVAGYEILSAIQFEHPVADIVYQHHERLDGSGYPRGLADADIMEQARILAVADVVEAMASHRPYRASLGVEAALAEVRGGAGERYDTAAVEACERVFAAGFEFGAE